MNRFKSLRKSIIFLIEFAESLFAIKRGSSAITVFGNNLDIKASNSSAANTSKNADLFKREYFNDRNESIDRFRDLRCFTSKCSHARTGTDRDARNISVFTWYYRPVQQGRPGIILKSLAYSAIHKDNKLRADMAIGSACLAGCYYSDSSNYYHFWCDAIVDAWIMYCQITDEYKPEFIIMPFSAKKWQKEILDICSIPLDKIIGLHQFTEITIKNSSVLFRAKGGRVSPPWLFQALTSIVKPSLYEARDYPKRIYSARRQSGRRPLVNEDEVIKLMIAHGYTIIDCSGETVRSQILLFRNASHIVAPHGASLTNIAWCKPKTYILDLMPSTHLNPCFHDLAKQGDLNYLIYFSTPIDPREDPLSCPVVIDIDNFRSFILNSEFASPAQSRR